MGTITCSPRQAQTLWRYFSPLSTFVEHFLKRQYKYALFEHVIEPAKVGLLRDSLVSKCSCLACFRKKYVDSSCTASCAARLARNQSLHLQIFSIFRIVSDDSCSLPST